MEYYLKISAIVWLLSTLLATVLFFTKSHRVIGYLPILMTSVVCQISFTATAIFVMVKFWGVS